MIPAFLNKAKSHKILAPVFERVKDVEWMDDAIHLYFGSEFDAQILKLQEKTVTGWAQQVWGPGIRWETQVREDVEVNPPEPAKSPFQDQIALFRKVFRAEVIPPKEEKSL